MRKVKYVTHGFFGGKGNYAPSLIRDGWFHGFFQEGSLEQGADPCALVETSIGEVVSISASQIKFESQPANTEEINE